MARRTALSSAAIGTAINDLIEPCSPPGSPRPSEPPAPAQLPALALAFSGGGFRASLSALGALRFVADAGLLSRVRYVSSVSGGSITTGLLALAHPHLEAEGFSRQALDQ